MKKTIDEILGSYLFFLDVELCIQGRYLGKKIITGIPAPDGLPAWFTLQDLHFPQQIYVAGLEIPEELRRNAILDITGRLEMRDDGLFYFNGTDVL